MTRTHADQT